MKYISLIGVALFAFLMGTPTQYIQAQEATEISAVAIADRPCRCEITRKLFDEIIEGGDTMLISKIWISRDCPNQANCATKKCKIRFKAVDPKNKDNFTYFNEEMECVARSSPVPVPGQGRAKSGDLVVVEPVPITADKCKCPIKITVGGFVTIGDDSLLVYKAEIDNFCTKRDCSDKCRVKYSARGDGHHVEDALSVKQCEKK